MIVSFLLSSFLVPRDSSIAITVSFFLLFDLLHSSWPKELCQSR